VGHKTEILMDGGIRSGQDVLKAVALGAKAALVGRPILYGLGAGGEAGVMRAFDILRQEMDVSMALLGERDIGLVGPHNIYGSGL
jgi:L-lactate dehydrogenase (cytochrome)